MCKGMKTCSHSQENIRCHQFPDRSALAILLKSASCILRQATTHQKEHNFATNLEAWIKILQIVSIQSDLGDCHGRKNSHIPSSFTNSSDSQVARGSTSAQDDTSDETQRERGSLRFNLGSCCKKHTTFQSAQKSITTLMFNMICVGIAFGQHRIHDSEVNMLLLMFISTRCGSASVKAKFTPRRCRGRRSRKHTGCEIYDFNAVVRERQARQAGDVLQCRDILQPKSSQHQQLHLPSLVTQSSNCLREL